MYRLSKGWISLFLHDAMRMILYFTSTTTFLSSYSSFGYHTRLLVFLGGSLFFFGLGSGLGSFLTTGFFLLR